MVRLLSLALSVSAVSSVFAYQNLNEVLHNIEVNSHPQDSAVVVGGITDMIVNTCIGSGWDIDGLDRFTAIFFGDFYTGGSGEISGPLAVGGDFHAPGYIINTNGGSDPDDEDSLDYYGLIVGGVTKTKNTRVYGSAYLAEGGTVNHVRALDGGCVQTDEEAECLFDFETTKHALVQASIDFASLEPTLLLGPNHTLTNLRECGEDFYEVLTFNSCGEDVCSGLKNSESCPYNMLFGEDKWNGVKGTTIDASKTYILNIPVMNGETIILDTDSPSNGFNPCNTIYNIYPVNKHGEYCEDGEATVIRNTEGQLGGFILAPNVHIVDGSCGNFAGTVIGLSYTWEDLKAGAEILDYSACGSSCGCYMGCTPAQRILTEPVCPVIPAVQTDYRTKTETDTRIETKTDTHIETKTDFRTMTNIQTRIAIESRVSTVTSTSTITTTTTTTEQATTTVVSQETISFKQMETETVPGPVTTVTTTVDGPVTTVTTTVEGPTTTVTTTIEAPATTVTKTVAGPVINAGLGRPPTTVIQTVASPVSVTGPTTTVTQTECGPISYDAMLRPAATITLTSVSLVPTTIPITETVTDCPVIAPKNGIDKQPDEDVSKKEDDLVNDDYVKNHRGHHHGAGEECKEQFDDFIKKHLGHSHGPGEECNESSDSKDDDHIGHSHGPDEECNEDDDNDDDYTKNHHGHHHGPDEECNEGDDNDNDYTKNHHGHHHGPGEECNEGGNNDDDDQDY